VVYCDRAHALLTRLVDAQVGSAQMLVTDAFLQGLALDLRKSYLPTLTELAEHGLDRVVDRLKTLTRLVPDWGPKGLHKKRRSSQEARR
jgi:hypothetical protein